MSITPGPPVPSEHPRTEVSSTPRWVPLALVAAFALIAVVAYADYGVRQDLHKGLTDSQQQNQILTVELDKTNSRLAELTGQLEVTTQKLGMTQQDLEHARQLAQKLREQQKASDSQLRSQIGKVQADTANKIGQVSSELSSTQNDVAATKNDLEATKTKLQGTIGDMGVQSGLIAHNHDEVEELKRLGERNIFEFNLTKEKTPQKVGPIELVVRKLDPKHYRYTMNVIADDRSIEKKDKTVEEPVQFYVQGARAPYEIVVFTLTKKNMQGYLSTPKNSMRAPAATPSAAPSNPQ